MKASLLLVQASRRCRWAHLGLPGAWHLSSNQHFFQQTPCFPMLYLLSLLGIPPSPFHPLLPTQSVHWRGGLRAPVLFLSLQRGIISTLNFSQNWREQKGAFHFVGTRLRVGPLRADCQHGRQNNTCFVNNLKNFFAATYPAFFISPTFTLRQKKKKKRGGGGKRKVLLVLSNILLSH